MIENPNTTASEDAEFVIGMFVGVIVTLILVGIFWFALSLSGGHDDTVTMVQRDDVVVTRYEEAFKYCLNEDGWFGPVDAWETCNKIWGEGYPVPGFSRFHVDCYHLRFNFCDTDIWGRDK